MVGDRRHSHQETDAAGRGGLEPKDTHAAQAQLPGRVWEGRGERDGGPQSHLVTAREREQAGSRFPMRNAVFI